MRFWLTLGMAGAMLFGCGNDGDATEGMAVVPVNVVSADPIVDFDVDTDGHVYLVAQRSIGPTEVGITRDDGKTWKVMVTGGVQISDMEVVGTDTMIVVSDHGLVRYTQIRDEVWPAEVYPSSFGFDSYQYLYNAMDLFEGPDETLYAFRRVSSGSNLYQSEWLFVSRDKGISWENIPNPHNLDRVSVGNDGAIYGGSTAKVLYRSFDLGVTWEEMYTFDYALYRATATTAGVIFATLENGITHRSTDGGASFEPIDAYVPFEGAPGTMYSYRYGTPEASLWVSTDNFITHETYPIPLFMATFTAGISRADKMYLKAAIPVYFETPSRLKTLNLPDSTTPSFFIDDGGGYWSDLAPDIIRRDPTDGTWRFVLEAASMPHFHQADGDLVFDGALSPDRGETFIPMTPVPTLPDHDIVTRFYARAPNDGIYCSVEYYDIDLYTGSIPWAGTEVFESQDDGVTWVKIGDGYTITFVHPVNGDQLSYLGPPSDNTYRYSLDDGATWEDFTGEWLLTAYDAPSDMELWVKRDTFPAEFMRVDQTSRDEFPLHFDVGEGQAGAVYFDLDQHLVLRVNAGSPYVGRTVEPFDVD